MTDIHDKRVQKEKKKKKTQRKTQEDAFREACGGLSRKAGLGQVPRAGQSRGDGDKAGTSTPLQRGSGGAQGQPSTRQGWQKPLGELRASCCMQLGRSRALETQSPSPGAPCTPRMFSTGRNRLGTLGQSPEGPWGLGQSAPDL